MQELTDYLITFETKLIKAKNKEEAEEFAKAELEAGYLPGIKNVTEY